MKFTFRIIACILALLLSVGGLCACDGEDEGDGSRDVLDDAPQDSDTDESGSESEDESESESKKQEVNNPNKVLAKDLSKYKFVVSKDASSTVKRAAENACRAAASSWKTDGILNTDDYASASKEKYEVLIGQTNRTESKKYMNSLKANEGGYAVYGSKIVISGYGEDEIMGALNIFCADIILGLSQRKTVFLTSNDNLRTDVSKYVSIMSFNVYVSIQNDEEKKANAVNLIRMFNPDIFGVQEASPNWQTTLKKEFSGDYHIVGIGRDANGAGEAMQIFVRKSEFNIKSSGTKWLTNTPNKVSKVEFSDCNRIATYAVIERKSDGKIFNYVNTHLDHVGGQEEQVKYLGQIIDNNTQNGAPTFVTGDFNVTPDSQAFKDMKALGYTPSYDLAQKNYSKGVKTLGVSAIIDYCFVKNGVSGVVTHSYKVCNDSFFGPNSDHFPVLTVFRF